MKSKYLLSQYRSSDQSFYYILNKQGEEHINKSGGVACFWDITHGALDTCMTSVVICPKKEVVPYTVENIQRWVDFLNEINIPCVFDGEKNSKYLIRIPLLTEDGEKIYPYRLRFCVALTVIRYLWHKNMEVIPAAFFELQDALPEADKIKLFFAAHTYAHSYANTNHMLTGPVPQKLFTTKQWNALLNKDKTDLYKNTSVGVNQTFSGKDRITLHYACRGMESNLPEDFVKRFEQLLKIK